MDIVEKAEMYATWAHREQVRKYTGADYISHPRAVVELLRLINATPDMLAAGWLHDTVEDTDFTIDFIYDEFGTHIGNMVDNLTDKSVPADGNRVKRKEIDRLRWMRPLYPVLDSKTIKLADLIDNSSSILQYDPGFAKVYIEEKRLLLEVLKEGNHALWYTADKIVKKAQSDISAHYYKTNVL
jgi:(p)ppGpp synthase/HD superfamily hydrolase